MRNEDPALSLDDRSPKADYLSLLSMTNTHIWQLLLSYERWLCWQMQIKANNDAFGSD